MLLWQNKKIQFQSYFTLFKSDFENLRNLFKCFLLWFMWDMKVATLQTIFFFCKELGFIRHVTMRLPFLNTQSTLSSYQGNFTIYMQDLFSPQPNLEKELLMLLWYIANFESFRSMSDIFWRAKSSFLTNLCILPTNPWHTMRQKNDGTTVNSLFCLFPFLYKWNFERLCSSQVKKKISLVNFRIETQFFLH